MLSIYAIDLFDNFGWLYDCWLLQVDLPEEPDTEDEAETKKWRWKVKGVKKVNSERHSQRCDIELKLAVRSKITP